MFRSISKFSKTKVLILFLLTVFFFEIVNSNRTSILVTLRIFAVWFKSQVWDLRLKSDCEHQTKNLSKTLIIPLRFCDNPRFYSTRTSKKCHKIVTRPTKTDSYQDRELFERDTEVSGTGKQTLLNFSQQKSAMPFCI